MDPWCGLQQYLPVGKNQQLPMNQKKRQLPNHFHGSPLGFTTLPHNFYVDVTSGPSHSRGLLPNSISGLGVLPLQKGAGDEQETQRCPCGYSRVWGTAEEAGAFCGRHHAVHRRSSPTGWVQKCAQDTWWDPAMTQRAIYVIFCHNLQNKK